MGDYLRLTKVLLGEAGKYLVLLILVVLAIRLWRRWRAQAGGASRNSLVAALAVSALVLGAGYLALCHSLGNLYYYYGAEAMGAGRIPSALMLFDQSAHYWRSADAVGRRGVCLLLAGRASEGLQGLEEAKAMRHGVNSPLEQFYEGVFYFFQNQPDKAAPLLEGATVDTKFGWDATKLLAVAALGNNHPEQAEALMNPFNQLPVQDSEPDHGYVMASLLLLHGHTNESKALLDKFPDKQLSTFWKGKFDQLRTRVEH